MLDMRQVWMKVTWGLDCPWGCLVLQRTLEEEKNWENFPAEDKSDDPEKQQVDGEEVV